MLVVWILLGIFLFLVVAFGVACLYFDFHDPFNMKQALAVIEQRCSKEDYYLNVLKNLLDKMTNCPYVLNMDMRPIEVLRGGNNIRLLIVSNQFGVPRLFGYLKSNETPLIEYEKLRDKSKRFMKYGIKYSIGVEELASMIDRASKVKFMNETESMHNKKVFDYFKF